MVKGFWWTAVLALATMLGGCGTQTTQPIHAADTGVTEHPTGFAPTLVGRYYRVVRQDTSEGGVALRPRYGNIVYRPRQSEVAGFEGWDVLELPRDGSGVSAWLHLVLTRDAQAAIVWDGPAGRLAGWGRDGEVDGVPVYTRTFGAGEVTLPSPGEGAKPYTLLLAEADGAPSDEPRLPAGQSEVPVPNAACPDWVDNLYLATGPNGRIYESWHPQIDPVYWCYFDHEHGTDPSLVDYDPAFRYVADQNHRQQEQHEGFKGVGIRDVEAADGRRYHWYLNIHATTSAVARVCARHHTVVIAVVDAQSGELVAEIGYKGDFGAVASNQGDHPLVRPTFTTSCPDQHEIAAETEAVKRVRVANQAGVDDGGYETWRGGLDTTLGLDFRGATGMTFDVRDPVTSCDTLRCAGAIVTGSNGTRRTLRLNDVTLRYDTDTVRILDGADGKEDGVFYTDPYGKLPRAPGDEDAVRQYVKPGLDVSIDGFFATEDAWRALYVRDAHPAELTLEGSIGHTN